MAPRALSLQAYLAYARSAAVSGPKLGSKFGPELPERPRGTVVWAHADDPSEARALASLCQRIVHQRPEISCFLSGAAPKPGTGLVDGLVRIDLPGERSADCEAFAKALSPDFCLWGAELLRPSLLQAVKSTGATLIALPATKSWISGAPRWLPDPTNATLTLFDLIHTSSEATRRHLRRNGVPSEQVRLSGPLLDPGPPLECSDTAHEEIAALLAGRPVWLAARLRAAEASDVLRAHRRAVRLAHRLMLIVVPADQTDADTISRAAQAEQMRVCHWDAGETPDENTQVLLLEGCEDLGLWYRAAPLAFLGDSLVPGDGGSDPYEAAALGTAILYGPNVGAHLASYSKLVEAGAARIVRDSDSLATAVSHLIAPDQAASMAHAGWDVISSGADLIDGVLQDIFDRIDAQEAM